MAIDEFKGKIITDGEVGTEQLAMVEEETVGDQSAKLEG